MPQDVQCSTRGFNREEFSIESSPGELCQEELLTITGGGAPGRGAGGGALVGAGAMGVSTAVVTKKDGGSTGQALGTGATTGAFGGLLGAAGGGTIGHAIDEDKKYNQQLKMLKNLRR